MSEMKEMKEMSEMKDNGKELQNAGDAKDANGVMTAEYDRTGEAEQGKRGSGQKWPKAKRSTTELHEPPYITVPPAKMPRNPKKLQEGSYIYFDGHKYIFKGYELDPNGDMILKVVDISSLQNVRLAQLDLVLSVNEGQQPIYAPTLLALNAAIERHCAPPPGMPDVPGSDVGSIRTTNARWEETKLKAKARIQDVRFVEDYVKELEDQCRLRGATFKDKTQATIRACSMLTSGIVFQTYYDHRNQCIAANYDEEKLAAIMTRDKGHGSRMSTATLHFLDMVMKRLIRKQGYSPSTVYKQFMPGVLRRTGGLWANPDKFGGEVPQALVDLLLGKEGKVKAVLENPDYKDKLVPIKLPSNGWFYAYVRWFKSLPDGGEALMTQRYGGKTWADEHMMFDSFVEKAQFSRQFVFADHYWLDLFSVDEATRGTTGLRFRLWLTFYIDAYSRSVTGVSLLLEHPCIESIQTGLRNMVFPKTYLKDLGIDLPWICYGIPIQLFLDNAWSHHSESLESLAEHLTDDGRFDEMEIVPRAPYMARLGAIIESLFGNLRLQILEELARVGAIRSSKAEDMRNARKAARLLYDDVYKIIHQIIVRYQHTPHSGLGGMTPHEKWLEGIEHFPVEVPPPTQEILHLFLRKAPYTRIKTEKGLRAFGLEYRDDWFELYPEADSYGKTIQFEVRYDPTDISKLYLFIRKKFLGTVYAKKLRGADGKLQPISLAQKKLAQSLARKLKENPRYWFDFLGHIEDINDLGKIRGQEQRHAHQVQLAQSEKVAAEMLSESQAEVQLAAAAGAEGEIGSAGALNSSPTSAEAQGPRLTLVPPAKEAGKSRGKAGSKGTGRATGTGPGRGTGRGKTQQRTSHLTVVPNNADAPADTGANKAQAHQPQWQDSQPAADPASDELPPHSPPNVPVFTEEERMRLSGQWASSDEELDY